MPYKDPQKQKAAKDSWYKRNTAKHLACQAKRRAERKAWYRDLKKDLSCQECGENHIACLEFHHTDPDKKDGKVSRMVLAALSEETILAEIAKCIVLCSNCHQKLHWKEDT